jgi:cytochrome P450
MWPLEYLPLKKPQAAYQAYVEWGKYLDEMFQSKKEELAAGKSQEGLDLMGAMIGASLTTESNHESSGPNPPAQRILSDLEIIGNAFLFILGGHATTADSIHFSLIYLALRPSTQRRLQADLDHVFDSRPVSEWEYERDIKHLFSGVCGAVLAEQLRLIPPVVDIVKWNPVNAPPMPLTVDGKTCHVPPNTLIRISASGTHRNPNFWPSGPPADPAHPVHPTSNTDNDLEEFKPERWFLPPPGGDSESARILSPSLDGTLSQETTPDTSSALFRPARGSYIPFSDGQRACLGRRFGQVEVFAVLALIFKEYSVELAVDQIIHSSSEKCMRRPDEGVDGVGGKAGKADGMEEEAEKREAWERAAAEVRRMLRDDMVYSLTLQLDNKKVPLRLVRRGKERYWW